MCCIRCVTRIFMLFMLLLEMAFSLEFYIDGVNQSEKVTENERSTAYSVWYMDNNYIDSQMDKINQKIKITWNEWV